MRPLLLQGYLDNSASYSPNKCAATNGKDAIEYQHLFTRSNQLSHCLIDNGVSRQDRIIIYLERSVNFLTAIFGTLKADAIYIPVDTKTPADRLIKIFHDSKPSAVICDNHTIEKSCELFSNNARSFPIINLDFESHSSKIMPCRIVFRNEIDTYSKKQPVYKNLNTDTAYILYTSGSTGDPKGVMISHSNIKSYIEWAVEYFNITEKDVILGTAPFHFDMSTFDIYSSMYCRSTFCIATENLLLFPEKLMRFIEDEKITVWKSISSLLMYMSRTRAIKTGRIPTLKHVIFGGEVLHSKYLIDWMRSFPEKHFYNAYGPTEATGISLCYYIENIPESPDERIPIGRPCKDTDVILLDDDNNPVESGEIGELCISGAGLSSGYLNDQKQTEEAFVRHPSNNLETGFIYKTGDLARKQKDGNYEFISRKDHQVKIMGYRLELEEIEHQMLCADGVEDAAAILWEPGDGGIPELVAFFQSESSDVSIINSRLKKYLPHYMFPRKIIRTEFIPRSNRGKISRDQLNSHYSNLITKQNDK